MLRRSKTLSIVMSLCLCLAMLAPVFVAPPAAQAAAAIEYSPINTITAKTSADPVDDCSARAAIKVDDATVLDSTYGNYVTVKLPSGVEFGHNDIVADGQSGDVTVEIVGPGKGSLAPTLEKVDKRSFDLVVKGTGLVDKATIYVNFKSLKFKSGSGDIEVIFDAPSGSAFPDGKVTIGKIVSDGQTNISVSSVKNIGDGTSAIDAITIEELVAGTLQANDNITLKLTKGFTWDKSKADATGSWAFKGQTYTLNVDGRELKLDIPDTFKASTTPGKIVLNGLQISSTNSADFGDVEIDTDSNNSDVNDQTIVIAKYADYGVTLEEGTKETVTSGRTEQEIGDFTIKEGVAGSLLKGRSVKLELPDGVEWVTQRANADNVYELAKQPKIEKVDGSVNISKWTIEDSDNQIIKANIDDPSDIDSATLKFKDMEVKVKADFEGPIEITVSGSAGAKGTVKVAEAVKPVKISAENAKDIIVGQASQKVADIILTESDKDMIQDESDKKDIVISLEDGYKFTSKPTVTVEEGNLEIDSTKLQNEDNDLKIVIDSGSTKASKIRISDVNITAYRYVPVGPVKAELVAADFKTKEGDKTTVVGSNGGSTALADWATDKSMGDVVIANCVTPAEGASTQFKIGSNVYTVNGVAKIMDVAPYIKNSRTYVPVRYLAYALGVTESNVVWDAATNKVTITKGDKVAELTVGSTTITVNGEAQTMDVAPEITNSRTMLPARFVAEGLGATVGWDAASNTVYVQQ